MRDAIRICSRHGARCPFYGGLGRVDVTSVGGQKPRTIRRQQSGCPTPGRPTSRPGRRRSRRAKKTTVTRTTITPKTRLPIKIRARTRMLHDKDNGPKRNRHSHPGMRRALALVAGCRRSDGKPASCKIRPPAKRQASAAAGTTLRRSRSKQVGTGQPLKRRRAAASEPLKPIPESESNESADRRAPRWASQDVKPWPSKRPASRA